MKSSLPDEEDRASTKQNRHTNDHLPENELCIFHMKMECTHPKCGEPVFVVGKGAVEESQVLDDEGNWDDVYLTWYTPEYFIPHLKFFRIPDETPYEVKRCINASFNLFFVGSGSALNEIRNAIEFLMDALKVPRVGPNEEDPPEEVRWDLDKRVGKLSGEHRKYKQHLLAIKNLGNWGSHAVETTRQDVLNAYEVLHFVLDGIYEQREQQVTDLAQRIKKDKRSSLK